MSKNIIAFMAIIAMVLLCSARVINKPVYMVENSFTYHRKGDCAIAERGHSHCKLYITSVNNAVEEGCTPCNKCAE